MFIFQSCYNGNAAGFKLESLARLSDVRCTSSSDTLLSYLVQTFRDNNVLAFVKQFLKLEKTAR